MNPRKPYEPPKLTHLGTVAPEGFQAPPATEIPNCSPEGCSQICRSLELLRRDINSRMSTLESEVTQLHQRFDDTPPGMDLAKWAASQAGTAVVGIAELRKVMREELMKVRAGNRMGISIVTALSVIAVALVTAIASNWPAIREKQVLTIVEKRLDYFRGELSDRERNICHRCAEQRANLER